MLQVKSVTSQKSENELPANRIETDGSEGNTWNVPAPFFVIYYIDEAFYILGGAADELDCWKRSENNNV